MNSKEDKAQEDKIDVEELIKDFLIVNTDGLQKYLKAIWKVKKILINFKRIYHKEAMIKQKE